MVKGRINLTKGEVIEKVISLVEEKDDIFRNELITNPEKHKKLFHELISPFLKDPDVDTEFVFILVSLLNASQLGVALSKQYFGRHFVEMVTKKSINGHEDFYDFCLTLLKEIGSEMFRSVEPSCIKVNFGAALKEQGIELAEKDKKLIRFPFSVYLAVEDNVVVTQLLINLKIETDDVKIQSFFPETQNIDVGHDTASLEVKEALGLEVHEKNDLSVGANTGATKANSKTQTGSKKLKHRTDTQKLEQSRVASMKLIQAKAGGKEANFSFYDHGQRTLNGTMKISVDLVLPKEIETVSFSYAVKALFHSHEACESKGFEKIVC